MRSRDAALVVLGALLGATAAWLLRPDGGFTGATGISSDAEEVAALRQRVADLEQRLAERPAPALAPAPASSHRSALDVETSRSATAEGETVGDVPSAGTPSPTSRGARALVRRDTFLEDMSRSPPPGSPQVSSGGLRDWRSQPEVDLGPAPSAAEIPRLLESKDRADLERALREITRSRLRDFLPTLTELVNQPERRSDAPRLIDTIADLKDRRWSALQATGAPDTPIDGDLGTAWASKGPDMGPVTLTLEYDRAVRVDGVRIHETLAPGAVSRVEAKNAEGAWETIWEGESRRDLSPRWFEVPVRSTLFASNAIRLTVDTDRVPGWNEIDAVELVGDGLRQWASRASASSSYAD